MCCGPILNAHTYFVSACQLYRKETLTVSVLVQGTRVCRRGDPALALWLACPVGHCAPRGWREGARGGGTSRRCEGRLGLGALPLPAARPWGGRPGVGVGVVPVVPVCPCGCMAVRCVLWRCVVRWCLPPSSLPVCSPSRPLPAARPWGRRPGAGVVPVVSVRPCGCVAVLCVPWCRVVWWCSPHCVRFSLPLCSPCFAGAVYPFFFSPSLRRYPLPFAPFGILCPLVH